MKLIQNIDVYAPQHLGKKDVLTINDKIVKIVDAGTISAGGILADATVVDGSSLILTPGLLTVMFMCLEEAAKVVLLTVLRKQHWRDLLNLE